MILNTVKERYSIFCTDERHRTLDLGIWNPTLYLLSYIRIMRILPKRASPGLFVPGLLISTLLIAICRLFFCQKHDVEVSEAPLCLSPASKKRMTAQVGMPVQFLFIVFMFCCIESGMFYFLYLEPQSNVKHY